jgi:hypothetical protein
MYEAEIVVILLLLCYGRVVDGLKRIIGAGDIRRTMQSLAAVPSLRCLQIIITRPRFLAVTFSPELYCSTAGSRICGVSVS